ncbi:hypothetical protein BBJ28_00020908 [Nothophytophthora sp. Chile5]|nr:hypothetical protein BBJ28_00020908 [Nothophytophthora sp. Chile5]
MSEAEDACGCLACAVLCGVCCVAAAEEDKRERERAAAEEALRLKTPAVIQVNPVAVPTPYSQQKLKEQNDPQKEVEGCTKKATAKTSKKKKKKAKKSSSGSSRQLKTESKNRDEPPSN